MEWDNRPLPSTDCTLPAAADVVEAVNLPQASLAGRRARRRSQRSRPCRSLRRSLLHEPIADAWGTRRSCCAHSSGAGSARIGAMWTRRRAVRLGYSRRRRRFADWGGLSTLGGGYGILRREVGLGSDNLLSVDMVAADGQLVVAGAEENANLFWAVCGGGGDFRRGHVISRVAPGALWPLLYLCAPAYDVSLRARLCCHT